MRRRVRTALRRRAVGVVAFGVCIAVAIAGCGSSSSSKSSGKSSATAVKLMVMASVNSPIQSFPEAQLGAKVAGEEINAKGGINGHKVQILFCNTASEVDKAEACAREAVQDQVTAVVGQIDIFTTQDVPILQAAGIPDVGVSGDGYAVEYENPDVWTLQSGTLGQYAALPLAAKAAGDHTIAAAPANVPSAVEDAKEIKIVAEKIGMKYVGTVEVPDTGVTDYSPYAEKLAKLHPEAVANIISPAPDLGMLKAVHEVGLKVQWLNCIEAWGEQLSAQAEGLAEGMLITSPFPSVRSTKDALIKTFSEQMEKHGISPESTTSSKYPYWFLGINAWLSVWGVDEVAKSISGEITTTALKEALEKSKTLTLPGGFTWNPSEPGPSGLPRMNNWKEYFLKVEHGKTVTTSTPVANVASYVEALKE